MSTATYELRSVPDDRLLADLRALVATDCRTQARLLAHLGEVDARKLYCARGFASMHGYCTSALHLSEAAAYKRIAAARAARRFPAIYDAVAAGRVHVSGITVLAPHLTAANCAELLARATHQTKRQIEHLVAELAPKPDVPPSVRKLPARAASSANTRSVVRTASDAAAAALICAPAPPPPRAPARPVLQPLAPTRFKVQLTIGDQTRVGLQCAWTSADGSRCDERGGLEFHHIVPHGRGGPATADNVTLLCRAHNQYQGALDYGAGVVRPRPGRAGEPSAVYGSPATAWPGDRPALHVDESASGRVRPARAALLRRRSDGGPVRARAAPSRRRTKATPA